MSKTKELFWTFFKIGAFTFGGGYAMVALLQNEFVEEKKWVTKEELSEVITKNFWTWWQLRSLRPARWR